jgi:hypothetical protein
MTVNQIEKANREAGQHWFDRTTLRFFSSRIMGETRDVGRFVLFVSSERENERTPRLYTIRKFTKETGSVGTVGDFQQYGSRGEALGAMRKITAGDLKRIEEEKEQ